LKKIGFLVIAALMVIGLLVPSSTAMGAATDVIKVIIAGPMAYLQGDHMLKAAQLAANEINAAGGITVNGTTYNFTVVRCDTNEISDSAGAGAALQTVLNANPTARIAVGGFRTEGVNTELPVVTGNHCMFFINGAATAGLLAYVPYSATCSTYASQRYIFRATPFNSSFLVTNIFQMLVKVTDSIRHQMGWAAYNASDNVTFGANKTVRIGIFSESLTWAGPMIVALQARIPAFGAAFGWSLGTTQTVSDQEQKTVVDAKLNALKLDKDEVIATIMSGPVGAVFSTEKGKLGIPAIACGINVLAQDTNFWADTDGYCEDEITMGTWNENVNQTVLTGPFMTAFKNAYGVWPSYTAGTYDVLYALKAAILATGWNASDPQGSVDAIIPYFEDLSNARVTTSGTYGLYPMWDGNTTRASYTNTPAGLYPALNSTQLNAVYGGLYDSAGLGTAHNFTMPSFTSHDVIYGPTWVTGLFIQWEKAS
jgi:branched-chain amino acid transport system substrate-binding protein